MKKIILTIIATVALTGASYAGSIGIGVSGSLAKVAASGNEKTDVGTVTGGAINTNTASASDLGGIGTIFLDYQFDNGAVIGFSHVPFSADVSGKTHSRTETAQGIAGTDASGAVIRTAGAEVDNFNTLYVEYPLGAAFVKLGWSQIDVNTLENNITDSGTYGNATLDGYTAGFGVKGSLGGLFTKTSVEYTDFDTLSLKSTTANTLTADLDVTEIKFAIGKSF